MWNPSCVETPRSSALLTSRQGHTGVSLYATKDRTPQLLLLTMPTGFSFACGQLADFPSAH